MDDSPAIQREKSARAAELRAPPPRPPARSARAARRAPPLLPPAEIVATQFLDKFYKEVAEGDESIDALSEFYARPTRLTVAGVLIGTRPRTAAGWWWRVDTDDAHEQAHQLHAEYVDDGKHLEVDLHIRSFGGDMWRRQLRFSSVLSELEGKYYFVIVDDAVDKLSADAAAALARSPARGDRARQTWRAAPAPPPPPPLPAPPLPRVAEAPPAKRPRAHGGDEAPADAQRRPAQPVSLDALDEELNALIRECGAGGAGGRGAPPHALLAQPMNDWLRREAIRGVCSWFDAQGCGQFFESTTIEACLHFEPGAAAMTLSAGPVSNLLHDAASHASAYVVLDRGASIWDPRLVKKLVLERALCDDEGKFVGVLAHELMHVYIHGMRESNKFQKEEA